MMWKNIVEPARPQIKIWRMRIACWVLKATNTHSEYVLLIAISLQQLLHERASMLHYTYIVSCYTTGSYDCNQSFALFLEYFIFSYFHFILLMYITFVLYIPVDDHFLAEIYEGSSYAQHKFSIACICSLFGTVTVCIYSRLLLETLIINTTSNFKDLLWLLWHCSITSVRIDSWISSVPYYDISEKLRKPQINFRMLRSYMTLCYIKLKLKWF